MKTILSVLTAAGLAVALTGCSWVAMTRVPKDYQPSEKVDCSSYGWPIVDTILASASTIGAVQASDLDIAAFTAVSVLVTLLYATSAVTGFIWSNTCSEAREAHAEWKARPDSLRLVMAEKPRPKASRVPDRYRVFCRYRPGDKVRVETKTKVVLAEFLRCEPKGVRVKTRRRAVTVPFRKIWAVKKTEPDVPKAVAAKPAPAVKPPEPVEPEKPPPRIPEKAAAPVAEEQPGTASADCGAFVMEGARALWGMGAASSDHGPYTARRLADKRARRAVVDMFKRNLDILEMMSPQGVRARVAAFSRATVKKAVIVDRWINPQEEEHYSVAVLALSECGLEPELAEILWERLAKGK